MHPAEYYDSMFSSKKEFTKSSLFVFYLSIILTTGSLLQILSTTDFFENNDHILMKIPLVYAQDGNGGNGNGEGASDGNGGNGNGEGASDGNGDNENTDEVLTLRQEEEDDDDDENNYDDTSEGLSEEDLGEILTLENGEDDTEPPTTEPPTTEPPTTEPPTTEPPTTEPPTTEPPTTEPTIENDTSVQQAEQKTPQVVAEIVDKDVEDMEDYLGKTRDERVDRDICGHYSGVWNYDTKDCEIDDPDRKKEYEKERKESSRFDQVLCPGYGGEWNDKEKKCEIEDLEDRTDYEDTLCDDPADSILYDICNFGKYEGKTAEQIKEYDKNQCIYSFDGKWNEDTSSCETENEDYQKYLNQRHDIYSCITSGGKWNDQKNMCETKHPGDTNGDHDRTIIKKYYRDDDDDDDDDDIDSFAAYHMGYRNGKFDGMNNMPFNDIIPFGDNDDDDDNDAITWYKIGYRAGWDSVSGENQLLIK
jgi:hypothetical protein